MTAFQQFNTQPWLTPARVVSVTNLVGTYNNGPSNNGVGATLILSTGVLTIDGVVVNAGDRVLLASQNASLQNGLYVCNQAGAIGVAAVLQRTADFQCVEQMHAGFYVSIQAGTVNAGSFWALVEPVPQAVGVSAINFVQGVSTPSYSPYTLVYTLTAAELASAGKVTFLTPTSATCQYLITNVNVMVSTGLSGGGGDRLLVITDGTTSFNDTGITAALLGTPIFTLWGGTGNPIMVGATDLSAAGASIYFQYAGGTADYTTGSVQLAVTLVKVFA